MADQDIVRVTLIVSHVEKRAVENVARHRGITQSELMRFESINNIMAEYAQLLESNEVGAAQ